jgi:hypothetical protein
MIGSESSDGQEVAAATVDGPSLEHCGGAAPADGGTDSPVDDLFVDWVIEHCSTVEYVWSEKRPAWCPEWWKHPEAVERLFALWMARTQAYANNEDLAAASSWWVYHWDHHAPILFDTRTGPFRNCDAALGHLYEPDLAPFSIAPKRPPKRWRRGRQE